MPMMSAASTPSRRVMTSACSIRGAVLIENEIQFQLPFYLRIGRWSIERGRYAAVLGEEFTFEMQRRCHPAVHQLRLSARGHAFGPGHRRKVSAGDGWDPFGVGIAVSRREVHPFSKFRVEQTGGPDLRRK